MESISCVLSPEEQAQAEIFARAIFTCADPLNRQVINRYGYDLVQGITPPVTRMLDFIFILFHFPGVCEYIAPFINDDAHCTAFENAVAFGVHTLCTRQLLPEADHV